VIHKETSKIHTVYDLSYDKCGYPHFLIYKDGQWMRMSAKHFKPIDDEFDVWES
jgi:hypothetical protein